VAIRNPRGVAIHVVGDPELLAAGWLARTAERGGSIVLSGGTTVGKAYEAAAALVDDWSGAQAWFGDERAVPPDDEHSNYRLAKESLFDRLRVPPEVHRIRGELGAEAAAQSYDEKLAGVAFELALNGIGADGHTASIFPNAPALAERERRAVAAEPGLEPFVQRVTLTPPVFRATRLLIYLVTGESKAEAVRRALADEPSAATPASLVRGQETIAIVDASAAAQLG
jgi:6-phosphogluconolactonase